MKKSLGKLGTFVEFSLFNEPTSINWTVIGEQKELNIHGSHLGPFCYPKTIAAIADGSLDVKSPIANSFPLDHFDDAMQSSLGGTVLKNFVVPIQSPVSQRERLTWHVAAG